MKNWLIILLLIKFPFMVNSQTVSESLIHLNKVYDPLFSTERSNLSIEFIKSFEIAELDTSKFVVIQINSQNAQIEGYSSGISFFAGGGFWGSGSGWSTNTKVNREKGSAILQKQDFLEFYSGLENVFKYIKNKATFGPKGKDVVVTYEKEGLIFGGEYSNTLSSKISFYFSFGDAAFKMTESDFSQIVKTCRDIRDRW